MSQTNGHNGNYTAQQFIDAIPGSGGIVSTIAARVGCAWNTAKKYIDEYATVAKAYQDEQERALDRAESVVFGNIALALKALQAEGRTEQVDSSDAKWLLARKGKERGYVERVQQEHSGPDGGPIETVTRIDVSQLTDAELDTLAGLADRVGTDTPGTGQA